MSNHEIEMGKNLTPRFDENGLIPVIVQDELSKDILMLAYMNKEALEKTIETKKAHYYSRSRKSLWLKGETSGQIQNVISLNIDCDQDTILLKVQVEGDGGCCHVGFNNCFYRQLNEDNQLEIIGKKPQ